MKPEKLERITDNILYLPHYEVTDRPVLGAVSGKERTLVIDTGASPAHARLFLNLLSEEDIARPELAVITHWHWDHWFGTAEMNLLTLGHLETQRIIREMTTLDWSDAALEKRVFDGIEIEFCRDCMVQELSEQERESMVLKAPDIGFEKSVIIDLGGITAVVEHVGGDHAHDSSVIYIPEERVLFIGDCVYSDLYNGETFTKKTLLELLDRLMTYGAEWYVDSHKEPLTREQMLRRCQLIKEDV